MLASRSFFRDKTDELRVLLSVTTIRTFATACPQIYKTIAMLTSEYVNEDHECMFKVKIFVDVGGVHTRSRAR